MAFFLCVGIYEELLFRGYFLRNLAEGLNLARLGPVVALLLAWIGSSLVFGAAHLSNPARLSSARRILRLRVFSWGWATC